MCLGVAAGGVGESAAPSPLGEDGGSVWGAFLGYGVASPINGSAGEPDLAAAAVRWSRVGRSHGTTRSALALELTPAIVGRMDAYAAGFNVLFELRLGEGGRWLPALRVGGGFLHADRPIPDGGTRSNFSLIAGFGTDVMLGRHLALLLEYRLHHVSNADTGDRNPGINAHTLLVGLSFYPRTPR